MNKDALFRSGAEVMAAFCGRNALPTPPINRFDGGTWAWNACAYYRPARGIAICVPRCAAIGTAGRAWSFPGYTVDRTPYGVLQHELGHHVDVQKGSIQHAEGSRMLERVYWSDFSKKVRDQSGEKAITSYCPNDAEWFAEMFRVFITNPDLLRLVRPRTHRELRSVFEPVFSDTWRDRLAGAPERTLNAAARHIEAAA